MRHFHLMDHRKITFLIFFSVCSDSVPRISRPASSVSGEVRYSHGSDSLPRASAGKRHVSSSSCVCWRFHMTSSKLAASGPSHLSVDVAQPVNNRFGF